MGQLFPDFTMRFTRSAFVVLALLPAFASAQSGVVNFSGYSWSVKDSASGTVGPGPNVFSGQNVSVDANGYLHLKISYANGVWSCAEVYLQSSLGYGTYKFTVQSPVGQLDPQVVLGLFTYSNLPAYNDREIDIELSKWANAADTNNAQYVVQPGSVASNLLRWLLPTSDTNTLHSFNWAQNTIGFLSQTSSGSTIKQWTYSKSANVPKPGNEVTHINLWLDQGLPPQNGQPVEVVLTKFAFQP